MLRHTSNLPDPRPTPHALHPLLFQLQADCHSPFLPTCRCRPLTLHSALLPFTLCCSDTTWFYSVDLTVDSETECSDFRTSDVSKVVFRSSLKATLEEIAGESFIGDGRVRCRNSLGGGTIRLIQVIVETKPGTAETLATRTSEAFATSEGLALFFTKLGNRMTNTEGFLEDFKSAYLATYKGGKSALGFSTELPARPEFNHREDLEVCPAVCVTLAVLP